MFGLVRCFALAAVAVVALIGCSPAIIFIPYSVEPVNHGSHPEERRLTAKAIGCDTRDVVIRDHVFGFWRSTWAAQCGARRFRCEIDMPPTSCVETKEALPTNIERGVERFTAGN